MMAVTYSAGVTSKAGLAAAMPPRRPPGLIHDEREGDAVALELPGGEPRPLQERASLRGVHALELALLPGGADDAQRGAVAAGGQRAGVAGGEQRDAVGEQGRAVGADAAAGLDILLVDTERLPYKGRGD